MAGEQPVVRIAELEIDPAQIGSYTALLREEIAESVRRGSCPCRP